jgi:hypothetical protein
LEERDERVKVYKRRRREMMVLRDTGTSSSSALTDVEGPAREVLLSDAGGDGRRGRMKASGWDDGSCSPGMADC